MAFKVLHVKGEGAAIEPSADYSASHVKWLVSSLSPVGPLIQSPEPVQYHGAVILYKVVDEHPSLSFRVYVATNNDSFIKVRLVPGRNAGGVGRGDAVSRMGYGEEMLLPHPSGCTQSHISISVSIIRLPYCKECQVRV